MGDVLIRGLSSRVRSRIQKLAKSENLSVNQVFLKLISLSVERLEKEEEEEERRKEAFHRVAELREELHRKYGKFEDSAKLIREDRDNR